MGRRLKSQRRGKGSPKYKATLNAKVDIRYSQYEGLVKGQVIELYTDPIRSAPVAKVLLSDGTFENLVCANGIKTGDKVEFGRGAAQRVGNVLFLDEISPGTQIFNIERNFGDGGKFIRATGGSATLVSRKDKVLVKMASGKIKSFPLNARATIGFVAASGRTSKPFVTAGNKFHAMKAKGKPYPRVRGVAMNPVDHPFGGFQHHVGHSKSTSRHAPSGRKVGAIASTRTGRKKK
ncbi:MAG: 50S ribosomal protein L2 [archaeon]|jgi:large subunit ribosomal protein L2|nr:50S ribosomal protein L2 [archaeon]MDD4221073.1 50S ribosomal protein L2 [Candidatus ainarchaeum sp.]